MESDHLYLIFKLPLARRGSAQDRNAVGVLKCGNWQSRPYCDERRPGTSPTLKIFRVENASEMMDDGQACSRAPRIQRKAPSSRGCGAFSPGLDAMPPPCGLCFDHWKPLRGEVVTWCEDFCKPRSGFGHTLQLAAKVIPKKPRCAGLPSSTSPATARSGGLLHYSSVRSAHF